MRIGMPTTSYPSHAGDAAGAFVRTLAVALARRGHTIDVIAPSVGRQDPLGDRGVHVHRVRYAPRVLERTFGRFGAPDNLARDPFAWPGALSFPLALARSIAEHEREWDAIVSHFVVPTSLVASRFARGRPHVAVAHGTDVHVAASIPGLAARVLRSADALVCVSRALAFRLDAQDAIIQPMGIDRDETRSLDRDAARARTKLTRFTALSLARLVPIKGIDVAIRAVASLDDVDLLIAGDGPERAGLETLARSLRAPVRFVGHVSSIDRIALLAGSDAFVAPTRTMGLRTEGAPTSVVEAMAAGLPIVASFALAALVGGAGLISDGTVDSIACDIARLRDDSTLCDRLARAGRRASRAHDASEVAKRFESLLRFDDHGVRGERRRERRLRDAPRVLELGQHDAVRRAAPVDDHHALERAVRIQVEPDTIDL